MGLVKNVKIAIRDPHRAVRFGKRVVDTAIDSPLRSFDMLTEVVTGTNPKFFRKYHELTNDIYITKDIQGSKMYLDVTDEGLSTDLINYGIREERATKQFQISLEELKDVVENVCVLEIGANIGYYALIEANILGNHGSIYAVEASPSNYAQLEKNINLNNYNEQFTTRNCAIGDKNSTVELEVSDHSNLHRVKNIEGVKDPDTGKLKQDTVEVDMYTVPSFLELEDVKPSEINVVRMDVEGFESEIINGGLAEIAESGGPLLLFIEIHAALMDDKPLDTVVNFLTEYNFELISVSTFSKEHNVGSVNDIKYMNDCPEVILKLGY